MPHTTHEACHTQHAVVGRFWTLECRSQSKDVKGPEFRRWAKICLEPLITIRKKLERNVQPSAKMEAQRSKEFTSRIREDFSSVVLPLLRIANQIIFLNIPSCVSYVSICRSLCDMKIMRRWPWYNPWRLFMIFWIPAPYSVWLSFKPLRNPQQRVPASSTLLQWYFGPWQTRLRRLWAFWTLFTSWLLHFSVSLKERPWQFEPAKAEVQIP